ncbi:MAG: methanol/ethanol family PQQ-dependent dehydrogenase [Alphaproteobacteria bacterium]|nr:methanol/ethanol family PQQ-dependent dehydrogenase [Alphaproteobacteria bacterium]
MRAMWRLISTPCAERGLDRDPVRALTGLLPAAIALALGAAVAPPAASQTAGSQLPVPPASAAPKDDGQWTMAEKNYAATRFSELDQINGGNVKDLRAEFTFSTGVNRGQEAAPLIVNNTMYIVTAFPNFLFALDLTKPGAPLKWEYQPNPDAASQGVACCDVVNRGAAYWDGKIIYNTLDNYTVAVDAETGKEVWKTKLGDINRGETMTMAPLVVKGKVLVGNSGGEMGVRGWITALDAKDGRQLWRAYSTGPDKDVLIGPDFHPFYDSDKGQDLGVKTWPPEAWMTGGGTVWGWIAYDPDLNLIYYGTANPGPWNQEQRPGDNKWTAGVFARDPDTGAAKWFYQSFPHDEHDYDGVNEIILLDMQVDGQSRKVLVHPDRDGYMYVLDRTTGQVISAHNYGPVNSTKGVDLKTGRPILNPDKETKLGQTVRDICPTASGTKDWEPSAFSPRTGLLYVPHANLCMDWEDVQVNYISGTPFVGANVEMKAGPGGNRGVLTAWDPVQGKPAWQDKEDLPVWSGALVTAGDLVFYGTMDGWFKAVDAKTGELKWQFKTGSGIIGQPVAYRGPDGREYIAILSGVGGWAGAIVAGNLDPKDPTGALGFVGAMKDLKSKTTPGGTLYVFALPPA